MDRNDCEATLYLHRTFRPRRRTGRGFLVGSVFLDAALLFSAFVLSTTPFVLKPGITINLPVAQESGGIRFNDRVLKITDSNVFFFNDEQIDLARLEPALRAAIEENPGIALIFEAHRSVSQETTATVYDAAAAAGFREVFMCTQQPAEQTTAP